MSYPFVGIKDFGVEKWDAAAIEKLLRDGARIYCLRDCSSFEEGKFRHTWFTSDDPDKNEESKRFQEFETFLELAAWLAFMGKDFL